MSVEMPKVLPNDPGLRSIGRQGECFYCHRDIGEQHRQDCVTVCKRVRYLVRVGGKSYDDLNGEVIGTFESTDPYHWTEHDCEFHKNGSSWCATNALDERLKWNDTIASGMMQQHIDDIDLFNYNDGCACNLLAFSFDAVINPGPFRSE